jgi:hypothetical protein
MTGAPGIHGECISEICHCQKLSFRLLPATKMHRSATSLHFIPTDISRAIGFGSAELFAAVVFRNQEADHDVDLTGRAYLGHLCLPNLEILGFLRSYQRMLERGKCKKGLIGS